MVASTKPRRSNTPRKPAGKPNASILSFFKKTEKPEDSLFVGASLDFPIQEDDTYNDQGRFNEIVTPVKKRRISLLENPSIKEDVSASSDPKINTAKTEPGDRTKSDKRLIRGPFLDSDSEDDDEAEAATPKSSMATKERPPLAPQILKSRDESPEKTCAQDSTQLVQPPSLTHEYSSCAQLKDVREFGEFGGADNGDLDLYEGEELREMRFMREQARLEAEEAEGFLVEDFANDTVDDGSMATKCLICNGSMAGLSTDDATRHVNSCLDGNPTPLPNQENTIFPKETSKTPEVESSDASKRFLQKSIPKPPQGNPFESTTSCQRSKSAFSKLMSNNVEDSAWATAAATEKASRGKPSYERTCPFYKIMPGFSICVDAFRYNAIEGCKAYFLSHFHSDHYIGLTARWIHGPIYCSKVTGSLVKKQLGTADKWVIELEFEKQYDIPGTDGATVTMIPANHCPGSSLFLFEKPMGKDPNSQVKRILHCGDFRACPSHIAHPLLKPEVQDSLSGKVRQQKIDICYLDTTYLNPRYSFPPQLDVIQASADLCAGMSPDPDCEDDDWDISSKGIGTPAVSRYFHKEPRKADAGSKKGPRQRLLVVCGTYSIGKERICIAIAKALNSKIFASPAKIKICKQLGIPELTERLTTNPLDAQVHMQMLMEIRAETLQEYLNNYKPHFSRIVGFRPSGWNFRPKDGKAVSANTPPSTIPTQKILHGEGWRTRFGYKDFVAQRGSTKEAACFGVPYSEHSSFRELAMFVMSLRIEKIVPTVNVGSEQSRVRMKAWTDRWMSERRRCGLLTPMIGGQDKDEKEVELWDAKPGKGGGAWW